MPSAIARPTASPATNVHQARRSCHLLATGSHAATHSRSRPLSPRSDFVFLPYSSPSSLSPAPAMLVDSVFHWVLVATPTTTRAMTAPCNQAAVPSKQHATHWPRSLPPPHSQPTLSDLRRPRAPSRDRKSVV